MHVSTMYHVVVFKLVVDFYVANLEVHFTTWDTSASETSASVSGDETVIGKFSI